VKGRGVLIPSARKKTERYAVSHRGYRVGRIAARKVLGGIGSAEKRPALKHEGNILQAHTNETHEETERGEKSDRPERRTNYVNLRAVSREILVARGGERMGIVGWPGVTRKGGRPS